YADGGQRVSNPAEPPFRTFVILGQRPEAFRAGGHRGYFTTVSDTSGASRAPFMAENTAMWLSTTRFRSASSGSMVHTPRCEVPPRTMPSLRAIIWMPRLAPGTGGTPPLV